MWEWWIWNLAIIGGSLIKIGPRTISCACGACARGANTQPAKPDADTDCDKLSIDGVGLSAFVAAFPEITVAAATRAPRVKVAADADLAISEWILHKKNKRRPGPR